MDFYERMKKVIMNAVSNTVDYRYLEYSILAIAGILNKFLGPLVI